MIGLDELQRRVGEWGNRTFPQSSRVSIARHLAEETAELRAALERGRPADAAAGPVAEEAADCLLLLLHLAHREGFSLLEAAAVKHAVNIGRRWETDDGGKGYWKHTQEQTTP